MNTLTEAMIAGVADGIDEATASKPVRSVIIRGAGRTLTAGYDLTPDDVETPKAPGPVPTTPRPPIGGPVPGTHGGTIGSSPATSYLSRRARTRKLAI